MNLVFLCFNRYVQPAFVDAAEETVLVVLPTPEALAWAEIYLRPQIRRRLGSILHCHALDVRFRLVETQQACPPPISAG